MKRNLPLIIFVLSFFAINVNAQSVFWGINIGTTSLQGSDAYTDGIAAGGAGFSTELNFGAIMKIRVPISPLTPAIIFNYSGLRGNDNGTETSQNIYSLGFRGQFTIIAGNISPYLALDLSYNFFGKYSITNPPAGYVASSMANGPVALSSQSRVGGGLGIGTDINLIEGIDIDLSGRIMILNLFGKKNNEDNLQAFTINAAVLF